MRRRWRTWDFVDRLGIAVTVVTFLLVVGLTLATCANGR